MNKRELKNIVKSEARIEKTAKNIEYLILKEI
jgi:hypothetical protein